MLGTKLPPLSVSEPSKPLGRGSATAATINFDYLVELQRRHQTIQAARGVRTQILDSSNSDRAQAESLRQQLTRKLHLALKEEQDLAVARDWARAGDSMACTRPGRTWRQCPRAKKRTCKRQFGECRTDSHGGRKAGIISSYFAATKRKAAFTKAKVPHRQGSGLHFTVHPPRRLWRDLDRQWPDGRTCSSKHTSLQTFATYSDLPTAVGNLGPLITEGSRVLRNPPKCPYKRRQADMVCQADMPMSGLIRRFRFFRQYAHIPPIHFLCLLTSAPKVVPTGLELCPDDVARFKILTKGTNRLQEAMKLFRKTGKRGGAAGVASDDDTDEET
ncbi:hypothetical protein DFH09DRAFT_1067684 [Mycena vulgaris]|nr:hypothetical protein DFH09DRAFT_1067684 [Mycena vulgaris]